MQDVLAVHMLTSIIRPTNNVILRLTLFGKCQTDLNTLLCPEELQKVCIHKQKYTLTEGCPAVVLISLDY